MSISTKIVFLILFILIIDLFLAQIAKVTIKFWDVSKIEKNYRIKSDIYHHDLAKMVDATGIWGIKQYKILTNSLGFKDKDNQIVDLKSDKYRLLFMGDSFTEGIGVSYENTFVGIIDDNFSKNGIEVLNAAVGTYSPSIYYRKVKYLLEDVQLKFNELVVFIDLSDIYDEIYFYDTDKNGNVVTKQAYLPVLISYKRSLTTKDRINAYLMNNSVLGRFIFTIMFNYFGSETPWGVCRHATLDNISINHEKSVWTVNKDAYDSYGYRGLEKSKHYLNKLLTLLNQNNIKMSIAVYPWPDQIYYNDKDSLQVHFWSKWAIEKNIDFYNLFPVFFEDNDKFNTIMRYYLPCDMHWNESGHKLVAGRFVELYRQLNNL